MNFQFTIIVPTCGRRSLGRSLDSIRDQVLIGGDEVLLVTDGPQPLAADLFRRSGLPGRCIETAATGDFGGSQRNRGLDLAKGDYLLFMDDDDVFAPNGLAVVRAALQEAPNRPHLFRMRYASDGRLLWTDRTFALGNISTQMIAFPNHTCLRRWDRWHGHDHRFIINNLSLWPSGCLVWREEVIAIIRPHEAPPTEKRVVGGHSEAAAAADARIGPLGPEECPFRDGVRENGQTAWCRLIQQISGAEDARWCEVRRDACAACCASFPPSPATINPVIASLLYSLCEGVIAQGGVTGCTAANADRLRSWAEGRV